MCLEMAAGERNTWEHLHAYKSIMMAMYLKIVLRLSNTFFSSWKCYWVQKAHFDDNFVRHHDVSSLITKNSISNYPWALRYELINFVNTSNVLGKSNYFEVGVT